MARNDRGMAQRYASRKRKRRAVPTRPSAAVAEPIRAPSADGDFDDAGEAPAAVLPRTSRVRIAPAPVAEHRRAAPRRTFASYGSEYGYVANDLRRVALVAGGLLLVLIVLSFFLG